jgi:hypothetical protein
LLGSLKHAALIAALRPRICPAQQFDLSSVTLPPIFGTELDERIPVCSELERIGEEAVEAM